MRDTTIRRLMLAAVITFATGTAGCMLIIASDEPHRGRYDNDDCEDCHAAVVIVDYKPAPDSSGTVAESTAVERAPGIAPAR